MVEKLTKKQKQILDFIVEFINLNGYSPSYQEIAEHFGFSSKATVFEHIKALEDKGYLKASSNQARALEPVKGIIKKPALELPLLGLIAAGKPLIAYEDKETLTVPADWVSDPSQAFILKVKGDSMIEEGIYDGDYVIVERNFYPQNGDIVVALLDNERVTLKKFHKEKNRIRLEPANPSLKPIYAKDVAIQGIVRAVLRKF